MIHILVDLFGKGSTRTRFYDVERNKVWTDLRDILVRERGTFRLTNADEPAEDCIQFISSAETDDVLELVEMAFRIASTLGPGAWHRCEQFGAGISLDNAVEELNHRFREHAAGYQLENSTIVRVDSAYVHSEVVVPALRLLSAEGFEGAADEFLQAHQRYREAKTKDAIAAASKAFEAR